MRCIACDYLAIQGSATLFFSSGVITGSSHCASLTPQMFEALQILKSAYHNGHIVAVYQAAEYMDVLIERLDDNNDT